MTFIGETHKTPHSFSQKKRANNRHTHREKSKRMRYIRYTCRPTEKFRPSALSRKRTVVKTHQQHQHQHQHTKLLNVSTLGFVDCRDKAVLLYPRDFDAALSLARSMVIEERNTFAGIYRSTHDIIAQVTAEQVCGAPHLSLPLCKEG